MHRLDAPPDLFELGLEVTLHGPSDGDHALAGAAAQVVEGFSLVLGQPPDRGAVRPGQVRHGLALPPAELADE
jgi:hypothetical protein